MAEHPRLRERVGSADVDLTGSEPVLGVLGSERLLTPLLVGRAGGPLGLTDDRQLGGLAPTVVTDDVLGEVPHPALDPAEGAARVIVGEQRARPALALGAAAGFALDLAERELAGTGDPDWHRAVVRIVLRLGHRFLPGWPRLRDYLEVAL